MRNRYENVKVFSEPIRSKKPARFVPKEGRVKPEKLKDILINEVDSHKSPGPDGNYPELCSEMTSSEPEHGACC